MNKNHIILALTGGLLFTLFYLVKCKRDPAPQPPANIPTIKEIKADLKADTLRFTRKNDSLQKRIAILEAEVVKSKKAHNSSQKNVNTWFEQAPVYLTGNADSSRFMAEIDRLQGLVAASDSLCNATISAQDSVIMAKTEQYEAAKLLNTEIRKSVDNLLTVVDGKDQQIKYFKKQTAKQKRGKAVLKIIAGAAILYGVKQSL